MERCPRCRRELRVQFIVKEGKKGKKYVIESCIAEDCNFNIEIYDYYGLGEDGERFRNDTSF